MQVSSGIDLPATNLENTPEKIEVGKVVSLFHCNLYDTEIVHKIAQVFLPGIATACVDNTTGDIFKTPASVAFHLRKEMVEYLTQRSENFVAETVIMEGGPEAEASDHPYNIISDFVDDFASSKMNLLSRVSGWLLSEKREDKIDDIVQGMEINRFWLTDRRQDIARMLLKNIDFKNKYHCGMKFDSPAELSKHVQSCRFRSMICENMGCNTVFSLRNSEKHDSACAFKIIPCEQKCSENIMRREMDRHCITVCPMRLISCHFYAVGCRSPLPHSMLEQHCSDDHHSHLLYVLRSIHKGASEEDLKKRADQLEKASNFCRLRNAPDARSLTSAVKDLETRLGPFRRNGENKDTEETGGTQKL